MDVTRAVVLAELGTVRWSPVVGAVGASGALAALDLAVWPGGPLSLVAWLAAAVLGGGAALALDEPRHDPGTAAPTAALRTVTRLMLPLLACGAWQAYAWRAMSAVRREGGTVSWTTLGVAGTAIVVGAAAAASLLQRAGHAEPGGVVASSAVAIAVGLTLVPLPGRLDPYDVTAVDSTTALWAVVTGLSVVGLWWGTRDAWSAGVT